MSPTASIPLTVLRNSNSKPRLRYRVDQEWNCSPAGNGILDHRVLSDTEKELTAYESTADALYKNRRRRSVSRVTGNNPSSRFNFVTAAFSRPIVPMPWQASQRMSQSQPMKDVGGANKKGWSWKLQSQLRGTRRKDQDLERGTHGNEDSDGIITLDLRKMSDEHEKRQSGALRRADVDTANQEDTKILISKPKKSAPTWVERQRDVVGSGSGHVIGIDAIMPIKTSSDADTFRREDPGARRKPKGPRSSVAGTSFITSAQPELKSQGSVESFDSLPVFRARPGYGSGSDWDTDYDDEFWSENEEEMGLDVHSRAVSRNVYTGFFRAKICVF